MRREVLTLLILLKRFFICVCELLVMIRLELFGIVIVIELHSAASLLPKGRKH